MKKIIAIIMIYLMVFTVSTVFAIGNDAEKTDITYDIISESSAETLIERYFTKYYTCIENLRIDRGIYDTIVDNEETHMYLKQLEYSINWREALNEGIYDTAVNKVEIKNISKAADGNSKITAYVVMEYKYCSDVTNTLTSCGSLWDITVENSDTPKIIALYSQSSDYHVAKKLIEENLSKKGNRAGYTTINAIDDAYETLDGRIDFLKELQESSDSVQNGSR